MFLNKQNNSHQRKNVTKTNIPRIVIFTLAINTNINVYCARRSFNAALRTFILSVFRNKDKIEAIGSKLLPITTHILLRKICAVEYARSVAMSKREEEREISPYYLV